MPDARASQALTLALAGVDWYTIADKLEFEDAADACAVALEAAEAQYDGPPVDPQRMLEVLRFNRLQSAVWPKAMKGELDAVSAVLNISDRRTRALRLNQRSRD